MGAENCHWCNEHKPGIIVSCGEKNAEVCENCGAIKQFLDKD